jgi:GntR family phosphonate transport system transcriptional regulator
MIERERGVALWRQIEERLAEDIAAGVYAAGSRLPTEPELAARFGVNRHTLRRAMSELEKRGVVRVEQGRGSFVQEHVLDYFVGRRTRFSEIVSQQNRRPGGRLLRAAEEAASAAVARALKIPSGAIVHRLTTLSEVDGRPMTVADHYFPKARFPDFIGVYAESGSITKALTRLGVGNYERKWTRVLARMPDAEEAEYLKLSRNRPLLVTEALNVDSEGGGVEYGISRFAADRTQIVFESETS